MPAVCSEMTFTCQHSAVGDIL